MKMTGWRSLGIAVAVGAFSLSAVACGGGSDSKSSGKTKDLVAVINVTGNALVKGGVKDQKMTVTCTQVGATKYEGTIAAKGGDLKLVATNTPGATKDASPVSTFVITAPVATVGSPGPEPVKAGKVTFSGQWQVDPSCKLVRIDGQLPISGAEGPATGLVTIHAPGP